MDVFRLARPFLALVTPPIRTCVFCSLSVRCSYDSHGASHSNTLLVEWNRTHIFLRELGTKSGMAERRAHVRYAALSSREELGTDELSSHETEDAEEEEDLRFKYEFPDEIPFKSIALALFLLSLGCFFLLISHSIVTEHMAGDSSQACGFLFLGFIVFLPGFYQTRIAYYSWRGFSGYSFSRIPTY